ncbi:LIM domain protein [Ditylenchus destructor]|nr:LIM domain protein [Ditylenchus destructor]
MLEERPRCLKKVQQKIRIPSRRSAIQPNVTVSSESRAPRSVQNSTPSQENWLTLRLKSMSAKHMRKEFSKVKEVQRKTHSGIVQDTLAARVYDVNVTAKVFRREILKKKKIKVNQVRKLKSSAKHAA